MLDRVGDQFCEGEGQRRRVGARQYPEATRERWMCLGVVRRSHLGDKQQHPLEHRIEVHILVQPLAEGVMHDGDRGDTAHRLGERFARLIGVRTPGLDPEQRRHSLQVVLHPMVDLADCCVLGDQFAFLVPQFCDIAAEHDGSDTLAAVPDRDGSKRHRHASGLDVGSPGGAAGDDQRQRLVDDELAGQQRRGHFGEGLGLELPRESHPVERRKPVGTREGDVTIHIEAQQAIGCARRPATRPRRRAQVGKVASRDHPEQVVCTVVEGEFLAAGRARLTQVRVAGDDGNRIWRRLSAGGREPAQHRYRAHPRRGLLVPVGRCGVHNLAGFESIRHLLLPLRLDLLSDKVAVEQGCRAGWAGVGDRHETAVYCWHPEHDVCEREVGE